MARTRPPNETMLPAAAPVEPGALALLVGLLLLPDPLVEVDSSPEAVDEGVEPVPEMMGIVALTPGTGVMGPPGTMGVAVGTTTEVKTVAVVSMVWSMVGSASRAYLGRQEQSQRGQMQRERKHLGRRERLRERERQSEKPLGRPGKCPRERGERQRRGRQRRK